MNCKTEHEVEIRILSRPAHLCVVRQALSAALGKYGFDEGTCGQMALAVDEALTNVMRHGYEGRDDQPIWVKFGRSDASGQPAVRIVIEDLARQVDAGRIAGRDLADVRPGGLGVHIMHRVMDAVEFAPRPGGGMRLVMTKNAASDTDGSTSQKGQP